MAQEFPPVQNPPASPEAGTRKGLNIWIILSLISAALICCCFVMFFIVPMLVSLAGPSFGNVFSNIMDGLATPLP